MREQGLVPAAWSNLAGERYEPHAHDYDKVIVVAEGSITFGMPGYSIGFVLGVGERLDLPAAVRHDAVVGPKGVTCLEAHLPAGTMGTGAKGRGYRW
jgi:hypothetical protein